MKIVLSGYYGHGNIGDEAILFSIAEQLKEHDLIVVSLNPEYTKKVQGLDAVDFFNADAVEEIIQRNDMVIMGGGGLFQEFPDIGYYDTRVSEFLTNPYGKPSGKLTAYAIVPVMAAVYGKPLVFLSHGVGPFHSEKAQAFYRFIFSLSSLITVRDGYSLAWVEKLCEGRGIHLSADPTFLLDAADDARISNFLKDHALNEKRFISFSLRELFYKDMLQKAAREIARALNSFLRKNELKVLFIPFQDIQMSDYPTQDVRTALQLRDMLDADLQERMVIAETSMRPQEILALMKKALFGIGMRYHFLIFSILNGTPVISISYDEKCNSLMKEIGLEDLSLNICDMNNEDLEERLHRMHGRFDEYRRIIAGAVPEMKQRASYSFALLKTVGTADIPVIDTRKGGDAEIDELHEMKNLLAHKDAHIREFKEKSNSQLLDSKRTIEELTTQILDKEKTLEKLRAEMSDRERLLEELGAELAIKDRAIEDKVQIISEIRYKLDTTLSSRTWRLSQLYGKHFYNTRMNAIIERFVDRIVGRAERADALVDESVKEDKSIKELPNIVHLVNQRERKSVFVVISAVEFDEIYNQRVINLSKYVAEKDFPVIYVAWRWSREQVVQGLYKEVYPNIFQIPVDDFVDCYDIFSHLVHKKKYFIIEFPHPQFFIPMLHLKEAGFINLYDIIDDWEGFHAVNQAPWFSKEYEDAFVTNVDIVTAVSPPLVKKFSYNRTDISLIPNGFSGSFLEGKADISRHHKNRENRIDIGYFGHLTDSWFDWDLIFKTAKNNEDFMFHIIGYGESEKISSEISQHKNITYHGKVHPSKLHQYAKNWDVAILPFRKSELSISVDPIKVYEYLYFGLPTIVQGIDHLNSLPYVHNCVGPKEFEDSIRNFTKMKRNGSVAYKEIEQYLKECVWERRFDSMLTLLGEYMS